MTNTFDADSHRVERDDGTDAVRYVYDGHNVLLQTDDASVTEAAYTLNPQPYGHVISRREPAAESLFHHFDGRHNTANLSDEVAAVAGEYQYDAFGKLLQGDPSATPHLYKGEVGYHHDADLDTGEGSYLAHHRVLSGGRFLSEDPAEDDLNTYRHVRNNPLNESDPSGLDGDPFRELGRLRNELEKLSPHVARKLVRRRIRSIVSGRPDNGKAGHETDIDAFRKMTAEVQEQVRARREFDEKSLSEKAAMRGYHFFIKAALANYDRVISPESQKRFGIDSPDLKREAELLDQTIGPRPVSDFGAENLDRLMNLDLSFDLGARYAAAAARDLILEEIGQIDQGIRLEHGVQARRDRLVFALTAIELAEELEIDPTDQAATERFFGVMEGYLKEERDTINRQLGNQPTAGMRQKLEAEREAVDKLLVALPQAQQAIQQGQGAVKVAGAIATAVGIIASEDDKEEQQPSDENIAPNKPVQATDADYRNPKPDTLYESNGYFYKTNSEGKLAEVSGDLRLKKAGRNRHQQSKVGHSSGVAGDEGGHMIGTQFEGRGEGPLHMVPQGMKLNRGAGSKWRAMEEEWAAALRRGDKVSVKIEVDWPEGAKRPDGFNVTYQITDPVKGTTSRLTKSFDNP